MNPRMPEVLSEPFMDLEKQIYNFDHHEGCKRPFTLSTCEQVLVMILKGMDLRGPDTLLSGLKAAAWVECLLTGFVLGLANGFVRERSQSVFPAILFHALGMAVFLIL
jgi:hypothetical protein